jgi:hypothetical protein
LLGFDKPRHFSHEKCFNLPIPNGSLSSQLTPGCKPLAGIEKTSMIKHSLITILSVLSLYSCSSVNSKSSRLDILDEVKKGYSVNLNSKPIDFQFTFLDRENIAEIRRHKSKKLIEIQTKTSPEFYSLEDIFYTYNVKIKPDIITIDGIPIDSLDLVKLKFEEKSISYFRLLTQKDYARKEFDSLQTIKETIGNGLVVINIK